MQPVTPTEGKVLLLLFKDFSTNYNASTLAQKINITRRGALKIVKHLHERGHLIGRKYGKGVFYKLNLAKTYTQQLLKVLLMGEAEQQTAKWQYQFRDLFQTTEAVILFGSIIRDEKKANDIDIVLVVKQGKFPAAQEQVKKENKTALKHIHPIWQLQGDIIRNLKKPDPVLVNALKFGYILHGYDFIIRVVYKAQQAHGHFAIPEPEAR